MKAKPFVFPNPNPDRIAYFYCDKANNEVELDSVLMILRALLRQLSTLEGYPLMRLIVEKFESIHEQRHISEEECKDLIVALCDVYPTTTLVLDGLDECNLEVRVSLIESVQEIMSRTHGTLKLFVTSRFEGDLSLALQDVEYSLALKAAHITHDITLFVKEQVAKSIGKGLPRTLSAGQQKTVIEILIDKADGMWVLSTASRVTSDLHGSTDNLQGFGGCNYPSQLLRSTRLPRMLWRALACCP